MNRRNHSGSYSKRYKRTHFWTQVQRRTVGPYGELVGGGRVPDCKHVKFSNSVDFGFNTTLATTFNVDENWPINQLNLLNFNPDVTFIGDSISQRLSTSTPGSSNVLYRAYNEQRAYPMGWQQDIVPYRQYTITGVKIKMVIRPQMTNAVSNWNQLTLTQIGRNVNVNRYKIGWFADVGMANNTWYNYNPSTTNPDPSNWQTLNQSTSKDLSPMGRQKYNTIQRYFSIPKYFALSPEDLYTEPTYSGTITYGEANDSNHPTAISAPASLAHLHFGCSVLCNDIDGSTPDVNDGPLAVNGTIYLKYYVRLAVPFSNASITST